MAKLRVMIIDDERLARDELCFLLTNFPDATVVAEADGIESGIEAIAQFHPDVIFLDLQLRGESGLRLLDYCADTAQIILVTGFEEQALVALEKGAHEFLLKPINPSRLDAVMEHVAQHFS